MFSKDNCLIFFALKNTQRYKNNKFKIFVDLEMYEIAVNEF